MGAIRYAIRDGCRLIMRNAGMSFLTIFSAMAVFYLIGVSTLFILNVRNVVGKLENELTIQAFIKPSVKLDDLDAKIKAFENIRSTQVITKEVALQRLRTRLGVQADAVALLGENPLPPSIEIRVEDVSSVNKVVDQLRKINEVDDVVYAGAVADKLTRVSRFIELFSVVIMAVALVTSGVVLFNTIRISAYSQEEEIAVMVMIGATPTHITLPFVIQGFLLGFFASLLAASLVTLTYFPAITKLSGLLPFFAFIESPDVMLKLSFMLICCGATVSLLASLFAVDRFIRLASEPL